MQSTKIISKSSAAYMIGMPLCVEYALIEVYKLYLSSRYKLEYNEHLISFWGERSKTQQCITSSPWGHIFSTKMTSFYHTIICLWGGMYHAYKYCTGSILFMRWYVDLHRTVAGVVHPCNESVHLKQTKKSFQ